MTPTTLLIFLIAAAVFAAVVPYLVFSGLSRRKKGALEKRVLSRARWEGTDIETAARNVAKDDVHIDPPRPVGKHSALAAPYRARKPSVFLTPRQLERVNMTRTLAGKKPLNRTGFTNAVAHAWDQPRRQPQTGNDWLTYLIMYEAFSPNLTSDRTTAHIGLTITPDAPYNGHGGEFAGAGASGDWTSPDASTATAAAAIAAGGAILSQPDPYEGVAASLGADSDNTPAAPSDSGSVSDTSSSGGDAGGGDGS